MPTAKQAETFKHFENLLKQVLVNQQPTFENQPQKNESNNESLLQLNVLLSRISHAN
jgi:hypothetical protein